MQDQDEEQRHHDREIKSTHGWNDLSHRSDDGLGNLVQESANGRTESRIEPRHDCSRKQDKDIDIKDREQNFRNAQENPAFVERAPDGGRTLIPCVDE